MNANYPSEVISMQNSLLKNIKGIATGPFLLLSFILISHLLYENAVPYLVTYSQLISNINVVELYLYWLSLGASFYWLLVRTLNTSTALLVKHAVFAKHVALRILLPFFSSVIKIIFCLILLNLLIQYAPISQLLSYFLNKMSSVLIITALSWILVKFVDVVGTLLLHHYNYDSTETSNNASRKIYTQILLIKRLIIGLISLLTVGSALMLFDNVRALGASVLTTAGIAGLVITFATQRSLGSIFAGLELAIIQPIKIGDQIRIENEFGTVEEINFRSVIIKLLDMRRLSVPTSYFLEKSFQNWSKQETNLIGSVYLYVDFTLPLSQLRSKLKDILKSSPLWDGKTGKIQVSDLKEQVMQLKILASARNANDLSNLKCEIREKLIHYIVENHPKCLPIKCATSIVTTI